MKYTWKTLNECIMDLNEEQCWDLLDQEKKGKKRIQFLARIYGRASKLRIQRERRELMENVK